MSFHKYPTFLLTATLATPAAILAVADQSETWRDHVDENDVRYLGRVARVMDGQFELRTLDQGVITFSIPDGQDYSAHVATGNEVQVWADGGTVSYVEGYGDPLEEDPVETSVVSDEPVATNEMSDPSSDETGNWDVDAEADASSDDTSAAATGAFTADIDSDGENEIEASGSVAVDSEGDDNFSASGDMATDSIDSSDDEWDPTADDTADDEEDTSGDSDDERWDGEQLPQTGSTLPLALTLGAILTAAGAWMRRR